MINKTRKSAVPKRTRRPRRPRCMVTYIDSRGGIHEWELTDGDAQAVVKAVRKLKKEAAGE